VRESDDYLLYAVTAWRQMSWQNFKKVFDALNLKYAADEDRRDGTTRQLAWRSLRVLDALGHADAAFEAGQGTVVAAPAVLCRLPVSGVPQAVLCGARSPGTGPALESACREFCCRLLIGPHRGRAPGSFIPMHLGVEGETEEALRRLAARLRAGFPPAPPAWSLLEYSGTAEEYACTRPLTEAPEIDWPRFDFDAGILQFRRPAGGAQAVRLSKYQHPSRGTTLFHLRRGGSFQNVDPAWGRYLVLKESAKNVLGYDARRFLLAVPAAAPLPRLLARACALCSGHAPCPAVPSGKPLGLPVSCMYELYSSVPPDIAAAVAAKVGQKLIPAALGCMPED
jgi:hypothetical protein